MTDILLTYLFLVPFHIVGPFPANADGCDNIVLHHQNHFIILYRQPSSVHSFCLFFPPPTQDYLHCGMLLQSTGSNPLLTAAHSHQTVMHKLYSAYDIFTYYVLAYIPVIETHGISDIIFCLISLLILIIVTL